MKEIMCRNIEKYVANHNREIAKQLQSQAAKSQLSIQSILGVSPSQIKGQIIFPLNNEQIIYYCSQYFIVHNLISKSDLIIEKQGCAHCKTLYIDTFQTQLKNQIIFTIEQSNNISYIGQLQTTGKITQSNLTSSFAQQQPTNYTWKISKLTHNQNINVIKMAYLPNKHYLYLLVSKGRQHLQKFLWIYDLKRQCKILCLQINPNLSKTEISSIWLAQQCTEVYLMGNNYFRLWTINFNEKTLKESNYRNIQRVLSNKKIIKIFNYNFHESKHIGILTSTHFILVKKNQLISCEQPLESSLKKGINKENIQIQLQNSLNQIGKLKYMFEVNDELESKRPKISSQIIKEDYSFQCASGVWNFQGLDFITIANKKGNILTYNIINGQLKLTNQIIPKKIHYFDAIVASKKGQIIIFSQNKRKELYIINKYLLNHDQNDEQLKKFWGAGHVSNQNILSIDSPALHQRVCTLGQDSSIKLWDFKGKERKIIFEQNIGDSPRHVVMHPCGLLLTINYLKQIKLMSILPTGLYEILSAKTNYSSIGMMYSQCGNYLVSNQKNLLMFYNPFTLKVLGYIESPEIKSTILSFYITPQGNYIVYFTSDYCLYIQFLNLNNDDKYEIIKPAHIQQEPYTCFYYQNSKNINNQNKIVQNLEEDNLFIGCTQHKYMVLYKNLGKTLIAEFPVEDCYITCLCVAQQWLFAATSKGSIRVYRWPILQQQCQLQVVNLQKRQVKLCPPKYQQYFFWHDGQKITKMHKLNFRNELIVIRQGGIMSVLTFNRLCVQKLQQALQRKKLSQIIHETFTITKNDSQKRNRMIEKTQNDIIKVQHEISKQKLIMQRKYIQQCLQIQKNYSQKTLFNQKQKQQYLLKLKQQIEFLKIQLNKKIIQNKVQQQLKQKQYKNKQKYEQNYNIKINNQIIKIRNDHKNNISLMINMQKQNIKNIKTSYRDQIIRLKNSFQEMIAITYPQIQHDHPLLKQTNQNINNRIKNNILNLRQSMRTNNRPADGNIDDIINQQQINMLNMKVEQVKQNNEKLKQQLMQIKDKVKFTQRQDQDLQKQLQECLQNYNSRRFNNLGLHSQVLKMRTQLIERSQIMENKQEIINQAFQQRQKLQNYKELVKGSLSKLQDKKQENCRIIMNQQFQLKLIYEQLVQNINNAEHVKRQQRRVQDLTKIIMNQKIEKQKEIEKHVHRLKEIKRYLLLQGLNQDAEQKKMYLQQENLLTTINFYKKRMSMQFLKDKKNKTLKKSALNLVLRQNKKILQECNLLRTQDFQYDHEILNLGRRIGQANNIIKIEEKINGQKTQVSQQKNQLQAIRALFNNHLANQYQSL